MTFGQFVYSPDPRHNLFRDQQLRGGRDWLVRRDLPPRENVWKMVMPPRGSALQSDVYSFPIQWKIGNVKYEKQCTFVVHEGEIIRLAEMADNGRRESIDEYVSSEAKIAPYRPPE